MKIYNGITKNISKDIGKTRRWFTLKNGCIIPIEIEDQFPEDKAEEVKEDIKPDVVIKEDLSLEELKNMKKDELNDYAASIGLTEIKSSMKKDDMVRDIIDYQNENN